MTTEHEPDCDCVNCMPLPRGRHVGTFILVRPEKLAAAEKLAKAVEDYERSIEQLSLGSQGASDRAAAHVRASDAMWEALEHWREVQK